MPWGELTSGSPPAGRERAPEKMSEAAQPWPCLAGDRVKYNVRDHLFADRYSTREPTAGVHGCAESEWDCVGARPEAFQWDSEVPPCSDVQQQWLGSYRGPGCRLCLRHLRVTDKALPFAAHHLEGGTDRNPGNRCISTMSSGRDCPESSRTALEVGVGGSTRPVAGRSCPCTSSPVERAVSLGPLQVWQGQEQKKSQEIRASGVEKDECQRRLGRSPAEGVSPAGCGEVLGSR